MRALAWLVMIAACDYERPPRLDEQNNGDAGPGPCATNNGGCDVNATCSPSGALAVCSCKSGYVGDGRSCRQMWQLLHTWPGVSLNYGFDAVAAGTSDRIYFAPDTGNTGVYFKSIDVGAGLLTDHPLPPLYNASQNEFCACGATQALVALGSTLYMFGNSAAKFNGTSWTNLEPLYPAGFHRSEATGVAVGSSVYLMGGTPTENRTVFFNTITETWTESAALPFNARLAGSYAVGTKIYLLGGGTVRNQNAVLETTSATPAWVQLADAPVGVDLYNAGVAQFNDKLVVMGVAGGTFNVYNPATNSWSASLSPPVVFGKLVTVGASVYMLGGDAAGITVHKLLAIE